MHLHKQIIWKSEYNIGFYKIDQEHQRLFNIAQQALIINQINNDDKEKTKLKDIIKELYAYIGTHFNNEQEYMKEMNYPELSRHIEIHKQILAKLNGLISQVNTLNVHDIEEQLYSFIEEYFVKHIILEDKKIQLWNVSLEDLRKSFGWKEIYSVHDESIDNENKKLFDIAQEAFIPVDQEHRTYKIREVLTRLYDYMKTHFSHEEEYMSSINYPQLEEQKNMHKEIIHILNDFVKNFPNIEPKLFEKELAQLIDITLVQHIIQEDRKIIKYSNSTTL